MVAATAIAGAGPIPGLAEGNAGFFFHKTVATTSVNPNLSFTLAVDHPAAIPGDTLTYSGTVVNMATTWALTGVFTAESRLDATATVAYYWDEVQYCRQGCGNGDNKFWTTFAAFVNGQPGYTPAEPPAMTGGMVLTAVGTPASGVTFPPPSSDGILGTTLDPGAIARWSYQAAVTLTPAQVAVLSDSSQVQAVRNVAHFEATIRNVGAAQPWTDSATFRNDFAAGQHVGDATALAVSVTEPDGSTVKVDVGTLAPGASAPYSTTFSVPVPAPKGPAETDSAYIARLASLDGALLTASATLSGSGSGGPVTAPAPPPVMTIEKVPVVTIAKSGPATIDAGDTGQYPLALTNNGSAPASGLSVLDSVPGGASGIVTGVSQTLAAAGSPGSTATATASFDVPLSQPAGPLTDTASVAWQDANHNPYGPVSSQFTTQVQNSLFGARLTLAPVSAGPNLPGTTQTLTATLLDRDGHPIANQVVTFHITGANPGSGTATTDADGHAVFTYTGANAGNDVAQATVTSGALTLNSNTSTISWGRLLQPIVTSVVQGNFFPNPTRSCTFGAGPNSTPAFEQTFPDILFNPPTSAVPHDISAVNTTTRPFTDLTVDVNGNYNGQIVAQGNGQQAGVGDLSTFYAEFTGSFVVNQPGDLTFRILHDDGYILGVGNGATRVNGDLLNNPPTTPFQGYDVVAASNAAATLVPGIATIHFPAAGTYPYELDYSECGGTELYLVLQSAQFIAQTDPLSIYVGYADGLRPGGSAFPFPWQGSPNVTFIGGCTFDAGALRFDNAGDTDITFDKVTVDLGSFPGAPHFDIWPANLVVPAHSILIVTQNVCYDFDTSDFSNAGCGGNNGVLPLVHVIRGGVTTTFTDTHQVLNTRGFDLACQGNESTPWQRIAGEANTINVPLPPAASLDISPFNVPGALLGQNQALTVSAMDGAGNPVANLPVTLQVFGPNARTLTATTTSAGLAVFAYVGTAAGVDSIQASAFISGLRAISNLGSVTWTAPLGGGPNPGPNPDPNAPPPPSITAPSPADGSLVTKPVAITATIAPPAGQTIASWRVFYQALDPGPQVVIASGTGTPPSTLATFDPTLLPDDTYGITVEATASGGGIQDLTTTVVVFGNLKLGRYTTTYQDLAVPVNGFQMEVRRTYDSIDKSPGDFGVGWKVSVSNFRLAPNRVLGAGGWTMYNKQCFLGLCITGYKNAAPRFVTVTFPDQHTEIFDFTPQGGSNLFWECTPGFTARASSGTTSTLQPVDDTSCSYNGDGNLYGSSGPYSPNRFRLTTHDGTVLVLDRTLGLVSERDRNGNTLSVDSTGLHSSSGGSITFTRDASGRITRITGPSAQSLSYTYSAAGDLASSTDAVGSLTTYTYDAQHNLVSASGGAQPLQSFQYDSSGRLVGITDAVGNTTSVSNDVAGKQETVTDPLGRLTTVFTMDDLGDVIRIDQIAGGSTLTTTATYDSVGRPLSRTDPLRHVWTATYDASGNLTEVSTPTANGVSVDYDSFGFPLSLRDALGNETSVVYDSRGNAVSITDALGHSETRTYDAAGNRISSTDALGNRWVYTFDASGNETSITDPNGHGIGFTYDSSERMTSSTDASGRTTTYTYDAMGHQTSATDALGGRTAFTYNAQGLVASRTDPLGHTTTYAYDSNHHLTSITDPLGQTTSYAYDEDGRLASQTDAAGGATMFAYDGFGRLVTETDPLGRTTSYTYDAAGRMASRTLPNGGRFTYAYDADGRQVSTTDPLGRITRSAYDVGGRVVSITDGLGAVTRYGLDALGRTVSTTDPLGHTTTNTNDAVGNLTAVTDALGATTSYTFDAVGNQTSASDPLGNVTTYGYDSNNRLVTSIDALHRTTTYSYDALGRQTQVRRPSGSPTSYTYDAAGRLTAIVDALGNTTRFGYDAAGRVVSSTDPKGNITTYAYDAAGRQTSITDALAGVVHTVYDAAGQKTSVTNPRGDVTTFTYDALGNPATQTDPSGGSTTHTYDAAGQLLSQTDPRGIRLTFTYDAAGRLTGAGFPGGSIAYRYDAAGHRTSMQDPTGTTNYGYDAVGRQTSVAAPQGTVGYAYDAAGRRTSMSQAARGSITYGYDAAGQLVSLRDWAGRAFSFVYTPDGQPLQTASPAGLATTYGYDAAGRLTAVHHDGGSAGAHFDYTLDANGNRSSVTSSAGTERYTFDALNRLVGVTYPNGDTAAYTYDAAGNQLSRRLNSTTTNYAYDSGGRLVSAGGITLTYDAAGNLTAAGASTFSWDYADRLTAAMVGGSTSTYTYDGDGYRVAAANGATTNSYLWDRAAALPTLVDDGAQGYVHVNQGLLEQSGPAAASSTFPLADGLGSVRVVADGSGSSAGTASYDAFGAVRSQTGSLSIFGFTGEQADPTGLLFLRARHYDPTTGRFLSQDSVQPNAPGTQGFNLYAYAANNPSTNTDPTGHDEYVLTLTPSTAIRPAAGLVGLAVAAALTIVALALSLALLCAVEVLPGCQPFPRAGTRPAEPGTGPLNPGAIRDLVNAVAKAAALCLASGLVSSATGIGKDNPCNRMPANTYLPGKDTGETTAHIKDAINGNADKGIPPHPEWAYLIRGTNSAPSRAWYRNDPRCAGNSLVLWCDEYPFFSTQQGGPGASLRLVPAAEQRIQSGTLTYFYDRKCHLVPDNPELGAFVVIPDLFPVTTSFCRGPR